MARWGRDVVWMIPPEVNQANSSKTRNFPLDEGACRGGLARLAEARSQMGQDS